MTTSSVQNSLLTPLNSYFTHNSSKEIFKNRSLSIMLKTASFVAVAATIAIAGLVLAFSILASGGTLFSLTLVFLAIATIPLSYGSSKLYQLSKKYENAQKIEQNVEAIRLDLHTKSATNVALIENLLKHIISYQHPGDAAKILEENLTKVQEALPKKKDGTPNTRDDALIAFIPLIARLDYWKTQIYSSWEESNNLYCSDPIFSKSRVEDDESAYLTYETTTCSSGLNAAIMLEIMAKPFRPETTYNDLGHIKPKSFGLRHCDKHYRTPDKLDDTYFVFHAKGFKPIQFDDVFKTMEEIIGIAKTILEKAEKGESLNPGQNPYLITDQLQVLRGYLFSPLPKPPAVVFN